MQSYGKYDKINRKILGSEKNDRKRAKEIYYWIN